MESSVFQYGCPDICVQHVNDPRTSTAITQVDLLTLSLGHVVDQPCPHYLEIGVSVGKTFSTVTSSLPACATAVAFDLEKPSPFLRSVLAPIQNASLPSNIQQFVGPGGQRVFYITGSVLEAAGWDSLSGLGVQFHLIFSDALHTPEGVAAEYREIHARKLLDTSAGFAMLWDDCAPGLRGPFNELCKEYALDCKVPMLHAWLGMYEAAHPTCAAFSGKVPIPGTAPLS